MDLASPPSPSRSCRYHRASTTDRACLRAAAPPGPVADWPVIRPADAHSNPAFAENHRVKTAQRKLSRGRRRPFTGPVSLGGALPAGAAGAVVRSALPADLSGSYRHGPTRWTREDGSSATDRAEAKGFTATGGGILKAGGFLRVQRPDPDRGRGRRPARRLTAGTFTRR